MVFKQNLWPEQHRFFVDLAINHRKIKKCENKHILKFQGFLKQIHVFQGVSFFK